MSAISEKEFMNLTISINKALNPMEAPLKMKHARSAIITTHHRKEAKSFWVVVTRQPLMENRFTAWKFCHLVHKVLREGHESTLKRSQTHKKMILEMGKLWGHLQDGVGNCVEAYSKLIVTKLDFHEKNQIFPGSLLLDFREIEKFAGDDINIYFQLCVEIFDYLDDIIEVQSRVFTSINTYRMSSMTPQGQCRLAPLITLIQDSNPLYDLSVRIMFKLHDKLPNDILFGHRDRFKKLFSELKYFYDNVRPLQYFADLIQVPHLPETAPNFTSKIDFGSYTPPVIVVQPDPEPAMDNLIDTSISEQSSPQISANEMNELEYKVQQKEFVIQELQNELVDVKSHYKLMENNYKGEITKQRDEINELSNEILSSREECINMRLLKDDLELKLSNTPILLQKASEEEEKAKVSEEKFNKLKVMYSQIRDEHIKLLRQHGESSKLLNKEKNSSEDLKAEIQELHREITNLAELKQIKDTLSNKNSDLEFSLVELSQNYQLTSKELNELKIAYKDLDICKFNEIEQLSAKTAALEAKFMEMTQKFEMTSNELNESKIAYKALDNCKYNEIKQLSAINESLKNEIVQMERDKSEIECLNVGLKEKQEILEKKHCDYEETLNRYQKDLEAEKGSITELNRVHENAINAKKNEIDGMKNYLFLVEAALEEKKLALAEINEEKISLHNNIQSLDKYISDLDMKLIAANAEIKSVLLEKNECKLKYDDILRNLLKCVLKTATLITTNKTNEVSQQNYDKSLKYITEMEVHLNELNTAYGSLIADQNNIEDLVQSSILLNYNFTMVHEECIFIYSTTTDIEKGQDIYDHLKLLYDPLVQLFTLLQNTGETEKLEHLINLIKVELVEIKKSVNHLINASSTSLDLGNLVEKELEEMDRAIEEAAIRFVEMLSNTRSKNSGIKLEVNEKILDTCTSLMECIKILIQKSKVLQDEIVSTGRGNTTIKEFYKRNSQWTEGLISASKSVAKGANLLLEAANKAVTSDSNQNFEIIVAAQEIAACTAQLVIASKVKAPKESKKLTELTKASRSVSQATGAVVATVKDCNKHLEQSLEFDISKLNASQVKTMEMEIHVKILELEQALQSERLKLSSFRRNHYQNTEN